MDDRRISRRGILKGLGLGAVAAGVPGLASLAQAAGAAGSTGAGRPGRSLRVAYLTDMHIFRDRPESDEGILFTVDHLKRQKKQPELILTGGDNMTGTMGQEFEAAMAMRRRWERAFKNNVKTPVIHCAGNHDHWGWNKPMSKATGNEPLYGKRFAQEMFEVDRLYFSREVGGWKVLVLDSVREFENGYQGGLDDAQMEWLRGELQSTPKSTPIVAVCHIPVTGISPLIVDGRGETFHQVPYGSILKNQYDVVGLFDQHENVKLVLGGHIHFEETVKVNHVTYYNGGAVSGAWWRTAAQDRERRESLRTTAGVPRLDRAKPGYSMIDLHADGTFDIELVHTGFQPK